jgi:hypothetical protein
MSVCFKYCVFSNTNFCDEPIPRPEETYGVRWVFLSVTRCSEEVEKERIRRHKRSEYEGTRGQSKKVQEVRVGRYRRSE